MFFTVRLHCTGTLWLLSSLSFIHSDSDKKTMVSKRVLYHHLCMCMNAPRDVSGALVLVGARVSGILRHYLMPRAYF